MLKIQIENVSKKDHHTVRLTPANGETLDPTTLKGAALWDDELLLCLSPKPIDLSCRGISETILFTTIPESIMDYELYVNSELVGSVAGFMETDGGEVLRIHGLDDSGVFGIENLTNECIRLTLSGGEDLDETNVVASDESNEAFFEFVYGEYGNRVLEVHLGPTRLNSVAIDYEYTSEVENNEPTSGLPNTPYEVVIKTTNRLPAKGITFQHAGNSYVLSNEQPQIKIPIVLPDNPTRYAIEYTPEITVDDPSYLLAGELPQMDVITVRPTGFNYGIPITFSRLNKPWLSQTGTTNATNSTAALYVENVNDRLYLGAHLSGEPVNDPYTLQLDSSFAGAKLYMPESYSLNPYLGTLDENGYIEFIHEGPILGRKEIETGLYLTDGDDPRPFFNIYGIYARPTSPTIHSDTLGDVYSGWTATMSAGFGNQITIANIPPSILEIEVSHDRWTHADSLVTAFHQPKRVTRANGSDPFVVIPDKPVRTYSSSNGNMSYFVNYIQVMFVENGVVSKRGMWIAYKLNVIDA